MTNSDPKITSASALPILVVDDEKSMREFLTIMLRKAGHDVITEDSGDAAIARLEEGHRFRLVITDLKMPDSSGIEVLEAVKSHDPACQVLVVTAYATAQTAISALKKGAYDYIEKPFKVDEAKTVVERALEKHELVNENLYLRKALEEQKRFGDMLGQSEPMQRVFEMITRVADTETTVLITGESGTGKELVARSIHNRGRRSDAPFVPVNCGAIPENLIESELFGHKKGAFTGAETDRQGLFVAAEDGTLFLDEVGELPENTQVKLLRVLQEKKIKPVGGSRERDIECRILAATNRNLREEVEAGDFREDLFYRLNVIPIEVPPLRERGDEDLELLIEHFIEEYSERIGHAVDGVREDTLKLLLDYSYPGNVRELENVIERAVTLETGALITPDVLPYHMQEESFDQVTQDIEIPDEGLELETMVEKLERRLIKKALKQTDGVKKEAAEKLGISFRSLRYRIKKYEMNQFRDEMS